ncbi:MAG: hypothetical protein LBK08_13055 [Treponema sp.]|jgi:hypothetical protein|nr:hypothetical protein [Treponema sp.]
MRRVVLCGVFAVLLSGGVSGAEYRDGRIKLVLHEATGRFSLYYLSDFASGRYEPFFVDQDPRTSFVSVMFNDTAYKLGDSVSFRFRAGGTETNPALIFESSFLTVTEEFSFIRTSGSAVTNGVQITIRAVNLNPREALVGLRVLLDTSLGEGNAGTPFITDTGPVTSETAIERGTGRRWISRNDRLSVMGSISEGVEKTPDLLHFANWKRLSEAPWKINYTPGRNFNYLPYSIGDSAVSYYFDPVLLARGQNRSCSLLLAAEDGAGFAAWQNGPSAPSGLLSDTADQVDQAEGKTPASSSPLLPLSPPVSSLPLPADGGAGAATANANTQEQDLALLRELIARIDACLAGTLSVTDDELGAMEAQIARIRTRYNLP